MTDVLQVAKRRFSYRPELNGLRAVAVAAVVLFHASAPGFSAGYLGVDVFFVLSGFLITSLLVVEAGGSASGYSLDLVAFYSRRARRLLPAATFVLLCTALTYRLTADPLSCHRSQTSFISAACYVANWAFIAADGNYWAEGRLVSPVKHYWSLAVEEQFYYIFPLSFIALGWAYRSCSGAAQRLLVPVVISILSGLSLALAVWLYYFDSVTASYMNTAARFYQLLGGSLLALAAPFVTLPCWVSSTGLCGIVAVLLSGGMLSSLLGGFLSFLATSVVILGMEGIPEDAASLSWTKRLLAFRPLTFVGECSYSIYLVHFPFIIIADLCGLLPATQKPALRVVLALMGSLLLGVGCRYMVEWPFQNINLAERWKKWVLVACIILVPVLATGPLLAILSPPMHHADLVGDDYAIPDIVYDIAQGKDIPPDVSRLVSVGDSHCSSANGLMSNLYARKSIHGRSFCQSSYPVSIYPSLKERDKEHTELILESLRGEAADYLVVWNVKVQFACLYRGQSCGFDSTLNDVVEDVRDLYETGVTEYFSEVLPLVKVAVIFMLPEPLPPFDPHACLAAHDDASECDWEVDHMRGYEETVAAYGAVRVASEAMDGPKVVLINPDQILCPSNTCHALDHDLSLYSNGNHVSPGTWRRLLPEVENMWQEAGIFVDPDKR